MHTRFKQCLRIGLIALISCNARAGYNPDLHHYQVKQQLDSWVDTQALPREITPVEALNAVKYRYGIDYLSAAFYQSLKQTEWEYANLTQALNTRQLAAVNEAAVLFFNAHHPGFIHHEVANLPDLRARYLNALRSQLELYSIDAEVEQHYFARYYGDDFMKASILSVALQLYKERYGEARAIENLSYQVGIRRTDSFVRWLLNLFINEQSHDILLRSGYDSLFTHNKTKDYLSCCSW